MKRAMFALFVGAASGFTWNLLKIDTGCTPCNQTAPFLVGGLMAGATYLAYKG